MLSLANEFSKYWLDGASRTAQGLRMGLSDPYPFHEEPAGVTLYTVIWEGETLRLRYYPAQSAHRHRTPLVVVYALVKRPFILDLIRERSVVENLNRQGFDIYLTDWLPPSRKDSWRGLDDYINCEMHSVVHEVARRCGVDRVNMLGYCLGGLLSVLWTALYPHTVKNLVTLTTPINTNVPKMPMYSTVAGLTDDTIDRVLNLYGNCPAWLIHSYFLAMAPAHHAIAKYLDL